MTPIFAEESMSFIQIIERLGALGLLAILVLWFVKSGYPAMVNKFTSALETLATKIQASLDKLGNDHVSAVKEIIADHATEQKECKEERAKSADVVLRVAEKAEVERDKDREIRLKLTGTIDEMNKTLRMIKPA